MTLRNTLTLIWLLLAPIAHAQSYPDYNATTVNDYAGVLSPEAETQLDRQLSDLRKDTDIEMTVLTLSRQNTYAPDQTLEEFATGLFNHWGIGDKDANTGILVLVLVQDRAMRIELGQGFGRDWDREAARVVDRSFLPAFRDARYEAGIVAGVSDIINTIALPYIQGEQAPSGGGGFSGLWLSLLAVPLLIMGFLNRIKDWFASQRSCPNCGKRSLSVTRKILKKATKSYSGRGDRITRCSACSYVDHSPYTIARRSSSSSSSSSFGGGRSGGGGASGRW